MKGTLKARQVAATTVAVWFFMGSFAWVLAGGTSPQSARAEEKSAAAAAGSASITGKVTFEGAAPAREKIKMAADPVCLGQHKEPVLNEDVVVNSGALQNVFVYVKEGLGNKAFPASSTPVVIDQEGCQYHPHVFGIQVGQPLEIRNSDATLHNINAQPKDNKKFNIAQPVKGMKTTKTFDKPEMGVPFKCNVHPWMGAVGHVMSHPFFAVSGEDGSFKISGLPAGTYTLEAWHEKLGSQTASVTVADGQTTTASFSFKGK